MAEENKMDKVDQYLLGELQGDDRKAFEESIQTDADFAQEMELHEAIFDAVSENDIIDYRAQLDAIQAQVDAEDSRTQAESEQKEAKVRSLRPVFSMRRVLAVAATVAVLLVAGFYFLNLGGSSASPDDLFAANYSAPEASDLAMRTNDPNDLTPIQQTILNQEKNFNTAFQAGNYPEALNALNAMLAADSKFEFQSKTKFYYNQGITLLRLENYGDAANAFDKVNRGEKLDAALWYKALALLKTDTEQAKTVLDRISSRKGHPQQEKAVEILEQLK